MTIAQREQCKVTNVPAQTYRYSIPHLIKIGCKHNITLDISRFTVESIQAGVVAGPGMIPKPITMPLSEVPLNRDRGWSVDSLDSMEEYVVFPGSGTKHPRRQPRSAPSEARAQSDDGFARFLKQHSSPTHQRVTAGGRIVPMEPIPAPPQFNLLIDNLARSKTSASPQKATATAEPEIGCKDIVPILNKTTTTNADLHSVSEQNTPTSKTMQNQDAGASQNDQANTSTDDIIGANLVPRLTDLTLLTPTSSAGLPQTFHNFPSLFNLNPLPLTHSEWESLALPLAGTIFDPYSNMLVSREEQQLNPNPPFLPVSGTDQMNFPVTRGDGFDLTGYQGGDAWPKWNMLMPPMPVDRTQLSYPVPASLTSAMATAGTSQGALTQQIGTHAQPGYLPQMPATDLQFNSTTMNHRPGQAGNVIVSMVTEDEVARAEADFHLIDNKLRGHDQYTASCHSSFTPQVKSHYAKERMKIVEQRDMARRKWMQLRGTFEGERAVQRSMGYLANPQQMSSTNAMTSTWTQKNGNANLNVRAAAWVPKDTHQVSGVQSQPNSATWYPKNMNQNSGVQSQPNSATWYPKDMNQNSGVQNHQHSAVPNVSKPSNFEKPTTYAFNTGYQNTGLAANVNPQVANPMAADRNLDAVVSPSSNVAPGPYLMQLYGANGGELSDRDVDEWGVRRGCAPPEVAQKQSEEEMKILSQQHNKMGAHKGSAHVNAQPDLGDSPLTTSPYPVDDWGSRIGPAPPGLQQLQIEQRDKLERMHPDHRRQISFATLDSLPTIKHQTNKTVSFVENHANTTYHIDNNHGDDDGSSIVHSDETGWSPMKAGQVPLPSQTDWEAVMEAGNKEKGVKTEVLMANGISIIVEGQGSKGARISTANRGGKGKGGRMMSESERHDITKQLMSMDKRVYGAADAARKPSSSGLGPWSPTDENNFFRNKGPSSVAIQSVTARGMMPGYDGVVDRNVRNVHQVLKPVPNMEHKINTSPAKTGSPSKRVMKDIWGVRAPPARAHVEMTEDGEVMGGVKKGMYKY